MNSQPSQALSPLFSLIDFDAIGREFGFIKRRSRKLSARGFFLLMMNSPVLGIGSFNRLASVLGPIEPDSMSRQGLARRFTIRSTAMLTKVRDALIEAQDRLSLNMVPVGPIKRVLVDGSTVVAMHPGNGRGRQGRSPLRSDRWKSCRIDTPPIVRTRSGIQPRNPPFPSRGRPRSEGSGIFQLGSGRGHWQSRSLPVHPAAFHGERISARRKIA
jgi:hypothetical protein